MNLDYKNILWFLGIIFIQIFFLDALDFGKSSSFFSPVIISFFVLKQRLNSLFPTFNFCIFLGIIIDIFRNSLGLNTAIILLVAYLKPTFLYFISSNEDFEKELELNMFNIGIVRFLMFFGVSIFFYHQLFFLLEQFSFQNFFSLFLKSLINTIVALLFLIFLQYIFIYKK